MKGTSSLFLFALLTSLPISSPNEVNSSSIKDDNVQLTVKDTFDQNLKENEQLIQEGGPENVLDQNLLIFEMLGPDSLKRLKYLVRDIFVIVKHELVRNKNLMLYAKGKEELKWSVFSEEEGINNIIPIEKLPSNIVSVYETKQLRPFGNLPRWTLEIICRLIREHRYGDEFMSRDVTISYIPIWAFEMFTVRERNILVTPGLLRQLFPRKTVHLLRRRLAIVNKDEKYKLFSLKWDNLPFWVLELANQEYNSATIKNIGHDAHCQCNVTLKKFLIHVLPLKKLDSFEGSKDIKITIDKIPQRILTFVEEVFKLEVVNKTLLEYSVPLDDILNKIFKETRSIFHNTSGPIFSNDIEADNFPNWLSTFLGEMTASPNLIENVTFENSSFEYLPRQTCCGILQQNVLIEIPKTTGKNSTLLEEKPSVELNLGPGTAYGESPWIEKTFRKKLKNMGNILKFHEIPEWMFEIFVENISNLNVECLLRTNIKIKEILDMIASVTMNETGPYFDNNGNIILDKIPLWGIAAVQNILKLNFDNMLQENEEDSILLMRTIKLDELLDILFEIAMKVNNDILEREQPEEIPKWITIYLSQKLKSYVLKFSPANPVRDDRKWVVSETSDSYIKSNKPSVFAKKLIERRIKLFNEGNLTGNIFPRRNELPNWAVDMVKIKFQRYYDKRLLMPINLEWVLTPFWVIELMKWKIPENSFMNSGMDQNVTVNEIIDFAIWITNATNNKNEKFVKTHVDFDDVPDWLIHFLSRHAGDENEDFESIFTLNRLLDWAMVHNIRRKWGTDGERVLTFKENLMKLPKSAVDQLKLILKECNQVEPPINFQIRNISFPSCAKLYVQKVLEERNLEIDADRIPDILPYWLSEIIQFTLIEEKDTIMAMQRRWTITDIVQWTTWVTKFKLKGMPLSSHIRLADIPDWVINLLKLMIKENPGDEKVMKYRFSTEELITWGIENTFKKKRNTVVDISQHQKVIPNWAIGPVEIIIKRINDREIIKDFEMPKNQLPIWMLDHIEKKLKSKKELDFKKVPYGVIELLQIKIQEFNGDRGVINADMILEDLLEDALRLVRRRKLCTGINTMLELKDLPEWVIDMLITTKKENKSNINVFNQITSLNKIINWSIKNSISKLDLKYGNKYTFKGLPLWLIKVINHKLNENRNYSFRTTEVKLPTCVVESISRVEEKYKKDLGMESLTTLHLVPRWVITFLQFKFRRNSIRLQHTVTMNELLKFSIWAVRTDDFAAINSFVTILDLPDWIFYFLKTKINVNKNVEMILRSTLTLLDIVDMATKNFLQNYLEDGTYTNFEMTEFPQWVKNLLKRKITLVNEDKIRFHITDDPLPTWVESKIIDVANFIYEDKKNMVTREIAPYWMVEFLKMKNKDQNNDNSTSKYEFKVNELIDFGLWITNRVNNAETKTISRKLKLFDIPYWLIEFIRGKIKFFREEEYLLNDNMRLEEILSIGIGFSISKKTCISYDKRLPDHIPKYMHIPRTIKETLLFKVQNFDHEKESKKFQAPNNQLPIWAAEYLMKLIRSEYAEEQEIIYGFLWEYVPNWLTEFLQYKIQKFCGSPKVMEMVVTRNEIVDWAVFITNERKINTKEELNSEWTEIPQWLIEFLTNQMKDNVFLHARMHRPLQLNMLLNLTISNVISDALDRSDPSKVQNGLKDIPTNIVNFIQETLDEINSRKIKLNKELFPLPEWVPKVINKAANDVLFDEFKNQDQLSVIKWEVLNSWITHFMGEIIKRRHFEEEVMEYKATMTEIIEFSVMYTNSLINNNGQHIRKIALSDLPEWLIEIIKSFLMEAKCNHSALGQTVKFRYLLEIAVHKSIIIQPIKRDEIFREKYNRNRESPSEVENIVQKEINHFNEHRKKNSNDPEDLTEGRRFVNYLTISMSETIQEMVSDWHEEIIAEEQGNPWESVPYWAIKFTQSIHDGNKGIRNLAHFKLSLRKIIRWLIVCIQKTKKVLGKDDSVMWNDLPDSILHLIEIVRKEGGNVDAMETKFSVQDIVRAGIFSVIKEDAIFYGLIKTDLKLKEIPEKIMDRLVLEISDANNVESVNEFKPSVTDLPSWALKLISNSVADVIGSRNSYINFLPIIKWELTHSWVIDLLRFLIDKQHTEKEVLMYEFTTEEVISIAVEQTKNRFNFQAVVARDIALVDIPECLVTFVKDAYKTHTDVDAFLQHRQTIYSLLVWSLKKCSPINTIMFNAALSNNNEVKEEVLPNWAENIILKEIDSYYNFYQPQLHIQSTKPLTFSTAVNLKRMVSNKIKEIEPYETVPAMEIIPYATIKFTQKILEIQKGRRDIMSHTVTVRQILHWVVGFLQTVADSYATNGRVTFSDIPKCIKHFIVDAGNCIEDHHHAMDFVVNLEKFVDYGIKEGLRSYLLGKNQKTVKTEFFEIPSEIVTSFMIKMRNMEEDKDSYILDLITDDMPHWAFQLIDDSRPPPPSLSEIPTSLTEDFYLSVMPESHMIDLLKLLIGRMKTRDDVITYKIPFSEFLKFALSYAITHYDMDETDEKLYFRFVEMPFWLMSYSSYLINVVLEETDQIMQERINISKPLTYFMGRKMVVTTDTEIDREISNFPLAEKYIKEWIAGFLKTKVHEYITAEKSIKYEKPKNVIQIWMVKKIINIFKQKLKERGDNYKDVQVRLEYIPFWIVEYIELQTEVSQGNKFVMDSVTTVNDFVAWVVMRTGCNKNESCYKNDLEWTDLPIWIADYIRVKSEEFGKVYVMENNMTTVREIITWGIEYAVSRKVYNNDLKQSKASIEGESIKWFTHQEIESVNRNKYMKKYENSEIVLPFFVKETVETIAKKHFGLNVSPNNLFSWEITPHWLIEMLKIKVDEHGNDRSILDYDIFLSEIIEYAVSLTKHLNDKIKVGLGKIRVIDLPEWLFELIKFKPEESTKSRISFLELLTWGIKNSIRSKIIKFENRDFDALTTVSDAQWVKDVLLMKISVNSEGKFRKEFHKPMNYLPVWTIDFIHKEVESIWHSYAEERPKDIWESIPYWLAQLIQSKLQEFSRRRVMKQSMTISEVLDWVIWINNETRKDLGINDRIEEDELFVLIADFLGIFKESGIENKMTLQDIISLTLNVTVAKTMVNKDTASLLHSLKGIPVWALKLINRAISLQNENPKTIGFKSSQNEFPESVYERFKEIIQIYTDKTGFSPSERIEPIPYWIEVFIMHKFSQVNSEKNLFEEESTVKEILEFAIQLTQTIQDKIQVGVRSNIRWINIPFWIVNFIKERSKLCDNEDCLTNQRSKLDHLLSWSLRNDIRWTICERGNGTQNKTRERLTESEIPVWLKETLSNTLKLSLQDDFITRYKTPLNQLPIWIVEYIHRKRLEISDIYDIPENKINVPFWVVELIQSSIMYHVNVKKVLKYRFSIDKMVDWVIWNIKRKKEMLGDKNEIKVNQIPPCVVKVITDLSKGHQIPTEAIHRSTVLSEMLSISMTFDISREKTNKYLPYWVLMMFQNQLEYINHHNSSNKFKDIKVELPSSIVEYVFTTVQKQYNISKFSNPIDSLEIIPHSLLEYIKMKLFELNDKQLRVMKHIVAHREIIDYAFWFTKKYMVNSREMRMDDIPSWLLMYSKMKLVVLGNKDAVNNHVITLRDLLDWAIYFGAGLKDNEKIKLMPKALEILPGWIIQYLKNTLKKVNNDLKVNEITPKKGFHRPLWALLTIFSLMESVYKDNYHSLPGTSNTIVPHWVIQLFQFKIKEFNGSSNALSSNMTVNDFVHWSMDNALSMHRQMDLKYKLEFHDVPEAVIDLLQMHLKRFENDQSVFKLNMTMRWILRWAIENNMEKIKMDEKNATFVRTPYSKFFPKWFLDHLKWRIKYSKNRQIKLMFHENLKPAPSWIKELIKAKFREHSDFSMSSKHKMTWKNLPTWLKTLVRVNMDEKSDIKLVMSSKMTIDDIIYYSLWFTKQSTDWEENLELSDIPEWSLELYAEIVNWNETKENILSKRFKLDEILDCAIKIMLKKYREKKEKERLIDWSKMDVQNLVGDYLKQLKVNENSLPTIIPDWVPTVVETVLKEYNGEDFLIKDYILTKYLSDDISARYSSKASMRDIIQVAESLVNTIKIKLKETEESEMYRMNNKTIIPSNDFPNELEKDLKPQEDKGTLHIKFIIKFLEEILEYVEDKIRFLLEDYKKLTKQNAGAFEEWTLDDTDFYRSDN